MEEDFILSTVLDLLQTIPNWHLISLFVAGMIAFIISVISGGGGAILLIPITSWMIGAAAAPPVINLATFISNGSRMYLFWHDIDWSLTKYYVPSAIVGAWLAALIFSRLDANWIQLLVGAFLVSTIFQYKFGKVSKTFDMPKVGFIPFGFRHCFYEHIGGWSWPHTQSFLYECRTRKRKSYCYQNSQFFFCGYYTNRELRFFWLTHCQTLDVWSRIGIGRCHRQYHWQTLFGRNEYQPI